MEEQSNSVFANRDEALPLFDAPVSSPKLSTRDRLKSKLPGRQEKRSESRSSLSLQERLYMKYVSLGSLGFRLDQAS
jgi:hypothetical protein